MTRALMASSASMEQCSLTGGSERCLAMSAFLMVAAPSMWRPFTHSVATLLLAMALPQPKVLKHESTMLPSSSTCDSGEEARVSGVVEAAREDQP